MNNDFWKRIDKLEELAGKATQGEWIVSNSNFLIGDANNLLIANSLCETRGQDQSRANARFIAAANPQTIREMIAELRRLEKEADWLAAILAGNLKIQGKRDGLNDPAGGHKDYWRNRVKKAISEDK